MKTVVVHKQARPPGRPPKYSGDLLPVACAMARLGATDAEIAEELGINRTLIYRWMNEKPEFVDACKTGKHAFDAGIVRGLAKKASWHTVTRQKHHFDKDTNTWHVIEYQEEVPPDTGAAIFWLKNRLPHEWRDKIDLDALVAHEHKVTDEQGNALSTRELAIAVLNALADGKRSHEQEHMRDVTPKSDPDRGEGHRRQPVATIEGAAAGREIREEDPASEDRPSATDVVEGASRRRRWPK